MQMLKKEGKAIHIVFLTLIITVYLIVLFFRNPNIFSYKFDTSLVKKYLCSQDISHEPPCKRLFLSDEDIHIAAGYLYAKGSDPIVYNFQHPPLIKYLYGYSIILFHNPYFVQIGLGILFLFLTYFLSLKIFKKTQISLLACLFLIADPLFLGISSNALLDLGQGVFLLLYFLLMLFYEESFLLQGITLGLLFASKFWGGSIFFILIITLYLLYKHQFNFKRYLMHFCVAVLVFSLIYIKTFINKGGFFNIIIFELKTFKFWTHHSVTAIYGSSLFLFLTGYLKSWWGNNYFLTQGGTWSLIWPIIFIITVFRLIKLLMKKEVKKEFLIAFIPVSYLFYLGIEAPFTRYFIIILPFFYMILANLIIKKLQSLFR